MYENLKGKFIVFEGGEGSGKTTQIQKLKEYLEKNTSLIIDCFREPGSTDISEDIRNVIMKHKTMSNETEAYLMAGARAQLVKEKIIPALKKNHVVLCDRFILSSLVYQGYVAELSAELVWNLNFFALQGYYPDINFYFDIEPKKGFERIKNNNRKTNKIENRGMEYHKKVQESYLKLCKKPETKIYKINAELSPDKIFEELLSVLLTLK